jgi:hypothetical protein
LRLQLIARGGERHLIHGMVTFATDDSGQLREGEQLIVVDLDVAEKKNAPIEKKRAQLFGRGSAQHRLEIGYDFGSQMRR